MPDSDLSQGTSLGT